MIGAVCLQNCSHRDEEIISDTKQVEKSEPVVNALSMKQDSARSLEVIENPSPKDPPVRDGDNWRFIQDER